MIVVIGSPIGRFADDVIVAGGMGSRIALAAAGSGRLVQLVGKTGDDATADSVVLDLARGGVGHVALLRDPGRATRLEPPTTEVAESIDDEVEPQATTVEMDAATTPGSEGAAADGPPGPALEAADVDLGLRCITNVGRIAALDEPGADLPYRAAVGEDRVR